MAFAALLGAAMVLVVPPPASAAVWTCSSSTPVASRPTLRYGDTGSCVKVLQNLLLAKGFAIGGSTADGRFGPGTLLGVRRYQSSRLDLSVDGVVGPKALPWPPSSSLAGSLKASSPRRRSNSSTESG